MSDVSAPEHRRASAGLRLACALLAALLVTACGNSDGDTAATATTEAGSGSTSTPEASDEFVPLEGVPGVTDEEIAFAVLGTGEASPLGGCTLECYAAGVQAYFDYRNAEGGVHGRQLTLTVVDDDLTNNQVKSLELAQSGDVFGVFAVPLVPSGYPDLGAAGVPTYTTYGQATATVGFESIFPIGGVPCLSCVTPAFAYEPTLVGGTRVGVLGLGVSQGAKDCVAGVARSVEHYGPELGVELAYENDTLPFGLPNGIAPEVTAMGDAGVDFVATCLDPNGTITIEQEMERQGMGDVPLVMSYGLGDPSLLEVNGDLVEGDLVRTLAPYSNESGLEAMDDFLEHIAEAGDEDTNLDQALDGWINAATAYEGLLAAGPEFDQAKVVAATNELEDFTAGGLMAPVDWGRQHEPPTADDPVTNGPDPRCLVWQRIVDGEPQVMGDPEKPFTCWDPRDFDSWVDPSQETFG